MTMTRRRLLDDTFKKTVVGNPAIAQGSLARRGPGITMQGWTEQDSTTGAQLFDRSTVIKNKYIDDSTGEMYDKVEGDTSASDYILVRGFSYICVTTTTFAQWMAFYDINKDFISGINGYGEPIQVPQNAEYARFTIPNPVVDTFMVNAGSELLPWEPYTGGQPSPSPDYPQEIVSAGKHIEATEDTEEQWQYEIGVGGAQLIPFPYFNSSTQDGGITYKVSENGEVEYYGTITSPGTNFLFSFENLLLDAGQYTLSYKGELGDNIHLRVYNNDLLTTIGVVNPTLTFTLDAATKVMIYLNSSAIGSAVNGHITPMLNKGSEPLPFELYKHSSALLTSDRPLTKWDKLTKKDGQWGWEYKSAEIESYTDESVPGEYYSTTGQLSTGAQVWYETTTETFVPLTTTEQEAMEALHTYRPTTVLSNDAGCEMSLTYKTRKSMEVTA